MTLHIAARPALSAHSFALKGLYLDSSFWPWLTPFLDNLARPHQLQASPFPLSTSKVSQSKSTACTTWCQYTVLPYMAAVLHPVADSAASARFPPPPAEECKLPLNSAASPCSPPVAIVAASWDTVPPRWRLSRGQT